MTSMLPWKWRGMVDRISVAPVGSELDEIEFFDDFEREWYTFEWWRRLMESNRPPKGICASNRDWLRGVE